jgi:hypothetical protein
MLSRPKGSRNEDVVPYEEEEEKFFLILLVILGDVLLLSLDSCAVLLGSIFSS